MVRLFVRQVKSSQAYAYYILHRKGGYGKFAVFVKVSFKKYRSMCQRFT